MDPSQEGLVRGESVEKAGTTRGIRLIKIPHQPCHLYPQYICPLSPFQAIIIISLCIKCFHQNENYLGTLLHIFLKCTQTNPILTVASDK